MSSNKRPHSAEHFTDSRDFWWNADFIELLAARLGLSKVQRALDVGCGVGHWGRLLLPHLAADAHLTQLDREAEWVKEAATRAAAQGVGQRVTTIQGTAEALPFDDASFDFVTCQTVLIHLKNPQAAIAELCRVLKPGGLLAVAEPNNLTNSLLLGSHRFDLPADDIVELVRFQLLCERGKAALGEGYNSLGEMVPELFRRAGLRDLQAWSSDKAPMLTFPYQGVEQQIAVNETLDWARQRWWIWNEAETRRYFTAAGGTDEHFAVLWALAMRVSDLLVAQLTAGTAWSAGNGLLMLTAGRKAE